MLMGEALFIKFKFYSSSITLIRYPRNVECSHTAVIKHWEDSEDCMHDPIHVITCTILMVLPNYV